jgi:cytochrome c-type biogenesis protein CcmH
MRKNVIRWLLLVFVLALLPAAVYAQDDISDDEVNEVAKDLYCPVCESTPLDVCPTQACADWRELIRTKLAAGETQQDVLDYFARQYGDGVLANPPRRGVSLIVLWVLPVLLVLLGGLLFFRLLRSMRVAPAAGPLPNPLPKGEGTVGGPLPNPLPKGEGMVGGSLPSPLPKGEGTATGPLPSPRPKGEGASTDKSLDDYIARVERELKE